MDTTLKAKVTEIFTRYKFSNEDAAFISEVLNEIDNRQHQTFNANKELFLTQKDKVELIDRIQSVEKSVVKTIYTAGLIQLLAIMGSILAIMNFMLK